MRLPTRGMLELFGEYQKGKAPFPDEWPQIRASQLAGRRINNQVKVGIAQR